MIPISGILLEHWLISDGDLPLEEIFALASQVGKKWEWGVEISPCCTIIDFQPFPPLSEDFGIIDLQFEKTIILNSVVSSWKELWRTMAKANFQSDADLPKQLGFYTTGEDAISANMADSLRFGLDWKRCLNDQARNRAICPFTEQNLRNEAFAKTMEDSKKPRFVRITLPNYSSEVIDLIKDGSYFFIFGIDGQLP